MGGCYRLSLHLNPSSLPFFREDIKKYVNPGHGGPGGDKGSAVNHYLNSPPLYPRSKKLSRGNRKQIQHFLTLEKEVEVLETG